MILFLVPVGQNRFELYSEGRDEPEPVPHDREGFIRRWSRRIGVRWNELVETARRNNGGGRFARWRDALVCRLAESIAEQRTLWALRQVSAAVVRFPMSLDAERVRTILMTLLADGRRHHLRWLWVDLVLVIVSGVFALVPGPNVIAYYFLFRLIGHLQSWRGARAGMETISWTYEADAELAELGALADVPREQRASHVAAIAERLNLPRLSQFFDRVTV
jgi:hypothetical protein